MATQAMHRRTHPKRLVVFTYTSDTDLAQDDKTSAEGPSVRRKKLCTHPSVYNAFSHFSGKIGVPFSTERLEGDAVMMSVCSVQLQLEEERSRNPVIHWENETPTSTTIYVIKFHENLRDVAR